MKYKVSVYRIPDDYMTHPYEIVWDYDMIDKPVEGESVKEVEDYVVDYLKEFGENPNKFMIKVDQFEK